MTLPLHLQIEIDIHAQLHQKEIAKGFAKLRAKLPPDPNEGLARLQAALMNVGPYWPPIGAAQMDALGSWYPAVASNFSMQNAYPANCGILGIGSESVQAWLRA